MKGNFWKENWKEYLGASIGGSVGGMFIVFVQNSRNNLTEHSNIFLAIPVSFILCFILGYLFWLLVNSNSS